MKLKAVYILLICCVGLNAQNLDSIHPIEEVGVDVDKLQVLEYDLQFTLDSVLQYEGGAKLSDLLSDQTPVQVNQSGGRGSNSSILIRGMRAAHTQVNWNGLPINSLSLGMFNSSLASGYSFDNLSLSIGASSSTFGNGAIGGVVNMGTTTSFAEGLRIGLNSEVGSFGTSVLGGFVGYSNKRISYKLRYINEFVRNDFEFINNFKIGLPIERQLHSEYWNRSSVQSIGVKLGKWQVDVHSWWRSSLKHLPSPMSSSDVGAAFLQDSSIVNVFGLKRNYKRSKIDLRYGNALTYFRYTDKTNPNDEAFSIDSRINATRNFLNLGVVHFVSPNIKLLLNSSHQINNVRTSNYSSSPEEYRGFTNLVANMKSGWLGTKLGGGVQMVSNTKLTPVYFLETNASLFKYLKLVAKINRHFRVPTFNEKYWTPGGNIDLLPEDGWAADGGIVLHVKSKKAQLELLAKPYYMLVNNWVLWKDNGTNWAPVNLRKVRSKGVEGSVLLSTKVRSVKFEARNAITYTDVVSLEHETEAYIGKQLILIPKWINTSSLTVLWRGFRLAYFMKYTSTRFTTSENALTHVLEPYSLHHFAFGKQLKFKSFSALVNASIKNLTNRSYQVVESNPMPGRAYYLAINLMYNSNN